MNLITVCPFLQQQGPGVYQSLEREVRRSLEKSKGTVRSSSGSTAALVINYCERNGLPYRVTADGLNGQLSYFVERLT